MSKQYVEATIYQRNYEFIFIFLSVELWMSWKHFDKISKEIF